MDEKTLQLALEMAKMDDGTYHPGAMTAIRDVYRQFGAEGVEELHQKTNGFMDIWDKFVQAGKNAARLLGK
jgi:hypothetical protein